MAAYYLTPSERRTRAKAVIQQRKDLVAYNNYLKLQEQAKADEEMRQREQRVKENQNFFVRAISTVGDFAANVLTGAVKGLEGIYDLGAGLVGAVGGIFDKDFQNRVKDHISYDWTNETIGNPLQDALKYSYLKDGGIIEGVASGIGQMLPAVAVTVATGGAGTPALVTMGASAAGNATEQAFNDGAGYYQGLGYGVASGAVEIATEKMFGGATKALTGAGVLDGITRSVADTGIKRIAKNALEEGAEEIVSELANPLLRSIYKGKDALSEYKTADYWKGVGQAGVVGSLTALAYSGTVGYGLSKAGVGYVGKDADVADSLTEISSLKERGANLQSEGRLDAANEAKIADTVKKNYQNIERTLKKASPEKRAKLIEKFSLDKAFTADGAMSEQLNSWLNEATAVEQTSAENGEKAVEPRKDYYSFNLRGSEQTIRSDLSKLSENNQQEIKVYNGELSEKAQKNFTKMKKGLNALNKISGGNISFVVTEKNDAFNGVIVDNRTMYIGADAFDNDTWAGTLVHEYTHFAEGSKEYGKLMDYLAEEDIHVSDGNGGNKALWQKAQESVLGQPYGFTYDELSRIKNKIDSNEQLTAEEVKYYGNFRSEVNARMSEYLLGNEAFIDKIIAKDASLGKKIVTKIQNLIDMFKRLGNPEARAEYKQLKKAESLYLAAARKAGNQSLVKMIMRTSDEKAAEETAQRVDGEPQVQYNKKGSLIGKVFPTYRESQGGDANTLATRWAHRVDIIARDQTLVSFHDAWYLVEKFDDSDSGYQIVEKITEKDYNRIAEDIKRNGASGRIQSIQRSTYDIDKLNKSRNSNTRTEPSSHRLQAEYDRENHQVQRVDQEQPSRGQTQSDGSGDSTSRRASKQGVKYSLKEGEVSESALAELEREYTTALYVEEEARKKLDAIEGFDEQKEKLYSVLNDKTSTNAAINAALEEYAQWKKESGYGDAYKEYQEASRRANELDRESESMKDKLSKKLLERKYSAEEVSGFVQKAVRKFHTTTYLNRASYLLTTGSMLDFSDGQGYRVQDHREISEILNLPDYANHSDGMIIFMNMGNIRLQSYGIDIASMPSDKQISSLRGIISKVMAEYDEFVVDFSKPDGNTDGSITYPEGTSSARIIADIKKYFETGVLPEEPSELSKFRYSLKTVPPVQPTSNAWTPTIDTDRALARFPKLWNVKAEESEVRNPTQIKGTVSTYRKIFDALKKEGFDGRILDASSGLGYGTQAGITEYGFDVDDIEPYPDSKYKPKYTDYSSLDERYDVIISNAVLNVLPQDQRDALVIKMGELLNRGGRLYVNVRGDDVNNLASNPNNVKIGEMEWYVAPTGSYQKGFTRTELVAYLKDALGKNFTVEPTTLFGKSSAIVTKIAEDIRYSLKNDTTERRYFAELSDGQVKKLIADNSKLKVYTKAEAEGIVNNVVSNYLDFGEKYGVLSGKTRNQAVEMLWRGLNTADAGKQLSVALDIAEYIIQNSVMESVYDDADSDAHVWIIDLLRPYLHSIDLSNIKGDINHHYGNDKSVYALWGVRNGKKGLGADQVAQVLEEQGLRIDAESEADIFLQIDAVYKRAVQALKSKAKTLLSSVMKPNERKALKQQIAREVLLGFDNNGKPSKLSKIIDKYVKQANAWKRAYYEERSKNKLLNRILDKVQKIKDIKLGTFLNASQFKSEIFKGSIEKLANIKYRGNINEAGTRKIISDLSQWYVKENPMLEGCFDEEVFDMLKSIADGKGKLTVDELRTLENIIDYFKHFIERYNKVYRNGEFVDAQPIAEKYVGILNDNKNVKVGWFARFFGKIFDNAKHSYLRAFGDPMTVARRMDMYESGFYTEMLERLRESAVGAAVMEMEMREPLEEFYKKNKRYMKELSKRTVKYQGHDIPLPQAMLLYMTLNREQALRGLAESGFLYKTNDETFRVNGFAEGETLTAEELKAHAKAVQGELSKQFSELDNEYIGIAEKLFNDTCKEVKRDTDIKRKGYSNALEDYYVPIRRAFIAHSVDTSTFFDEMDRVSNASFNKDTVKGAKNELCIDALNSVIDIHVHAVSQYANLAMAIDEYDKLFNLDVGGNPNKPISVKSVGVNIWREGDTYFKKLISDIQGIPVVKGVGTKFMSFIRSGYAKFQLGANPKVWITQLSSFAAAGSILDVNSIVRGFAVKSKDVDRYCSLAKLRNNENTVAMAQGVLDNIGKVGNVLMTPIGKVDRFVVRKLFGACQVQVQKDSGLKIGTEENKVKAGELLKRVILETQQNSIATERSAAMRSGNELMKTLTMFTADSMKVVGRVIDSIGELSVLKAKRRVATDTKRIAELDEKIKKASKKARRSIAALVATALFIAAIAQLFRTLYKKDDEDDNIAVNMTVDAVGNLFGGLPIIKDIYARFMEGYDLDNYAYSAINDMFDSAEGIFDMAGNAFSGEWDSKELAANVKKLLFASGQITGIPTRNIYNIGYGLTKRFSPSTAYKMDNMFYDKNYRADLNKAIENDDDDMMATIAGIMLDENIGDVTSAAVRSELNDLIKAGYDVIPKSVGDSVTYEGEQYALTSRQAEEFKAIYSTANDALASLVKLSQYTSASDEIKAKAVNFVFDTYYNLALQDFLGVELEGKNVLFAEAIDIEKLAIIVAMARSLTADLDKNGKAISGTRKAKVQAYVNSLKLTAAQKYMIMGYLGYTNMKGKTQVNAYINRLKLTKSEKKALLRYSGYAA